MLLDFFFGTKYYAILMSNSLNNLHWYIFVRLHSLYNAFFSAFHSKQIYITIYFYLHVFENNDSNPSFHEEQLPLIAACSGFGWMFSHKLTGSLHVKTFTQKKKKL